jgi:hypothetical protein
MKLVTDNHEYELQEIQYPTYITFNRILPDEILYFEESIVGESGTGVPRYYYKALTFNNKYYILKEIHSIKINP